MRSSEFAFLLLMLFRPISPWTEARLQSTWSSADSSTSPRRLRRIVPSPGVVEVVRSVDRAEMLARQASVVTQARETRTAPGSLDTVVPARRPPSPEKVSEPPVVMVHSPRAELSPANTRRERYGIAAIMSRAGGATEHQQAAVAPPPSTTYVAAQTAADITQARVGAAADNSFDSVPTDYDVSDTTSRSRSGEPVTTTSMESSSSATGAATAGSGSGGGGSMDTDSTDKSAGTGSHKLHQMRDDSGYKSLETQQSLGTTDVRGAIRQWIKDGGGTMTSGSGRISGSDPSKDQGLDAPGPGRTQQSLGKTGGVGGGAGGGNASLLARLGTRSMDRPPPGLVAQPAAVVGRTQYSLEAPGVPVQFVAASPTELKDILVPVPKLAAVSDVKTAQNLDEPPTTSKKASSYSALTEFFASRSSGSSGQSATEDATQKRQHIPFVPESAFLEKFAERTQTVGRALTSSFDRIRQQAGSFLSRTTAVVRGSIDAEAPPPYPVDSPYRRASSSECQSTWTERDSKLTAVLDPYYRRSNSGEVFTGDNGSDNRWVRDDGKSLHPGTIPFTTPCRPTSIDQPRDEITTLTSSTATAGSKFVGPEAVMATATTPTTATKSPRLTARDTSSDVQPGSSQQLPATATGRFSAQRQDRCAHATKSVIPPSVQAIPSSHPTRSHAKQPHSVFCETASDPDFRRGNAKTASKRRREYRSKKQLQEVHHSGSLTETAPVHPAGPAPPVHAYSAVVGEPPSSSDNSLEQPSNCLEQPLSSLTAWNSPRRRPAEAARRKLRRRARLFLVFVRREP